jgi:hypothetical protein
MSADRDVSRIVRSWLNEDAYEDATRVLDAVLDQIDATPQRRAIWPVWRFLTMNSAMRMGVAGVAVIAIALVGINLYRGSSVGPGSSTLPSPSASGAPSTSPSPRLLTVALNPVEGAQAHGTVAIEVKGDSYTVTVTIEGLTPNSIHKLYLNAGTCNAIKSNVEITFAQDVRADASGKATSVTTYHNAYSIPAEGRVLVVHGDEPVRLACAELTP